MLCRLLGTALPAALMAAQAACGQVQEDVVYIAFGDSSTSGPSERDYVSFLPQLLGVAENALANEGNGGEVTAEGLERLRMVLDSGMFPNARVLLYWEGGNDIIDFVTATDPLLLSDPTGPEYSHRESLHALLDDTQSNIEAAIDMARESGLDVWVTTYFFLPEFSLNCDPLLLSLLLPIQSANANAYTGLLNERIRLAAALSGAGVVDVAALDEVLREDPENYENCNHLSAKGNQIVAELFSRMIPTPTP